MKRLFLLALVVSGTAFAEGGQDIDTGLPLGNGRYLSSRSSNGQTDNRILRSNSSDNTEVNAPSGKSVKTSIAGTPVVSVDTNGMTFTSGLQQPVFSAAAVITPAVTYGAGLGALTGRYNILAAGAPTSAFVEIPVPTANVGKKVTLFNQGSNPVAMVPKAGVVNVSGALTPFSCTTLKECECTGLTTGVWGCSQK